MHKILTALFALLVCASSARAQLITVGSFDDIQFWTGSGPNRSALVLQFGPPESPSAVAWGYRWETTTQLSEMVFALAGTIAGGPAPQPGSDPRLSLQVFDFGFGYFVDALRYDQAGLPAGWSQEMRLIPGWDGVNWANLFLLEGAPVWNGAPFVQAQVGISDITLAHGGWYGFVQADGPETLVFAQPVAAVPEPGTGWLLLAGGGLLLGVLRRRLVS